MNLRLFNDVVSKAVIKVEWKWQIILRGKLTGILKQVVLTYCRPGYVDWRYHAGINLTTNLPE